MVLGGKNGTKIQTKNIQDGRNNMQEGAEALGDVEDQAYVGDIA